MNSNNICLTVNTSNSSAKYNLLCIKKPGCKWDEMTEGSRKLQMWSSITHDLYQILLRSSNKEG
jgi:hypothetical protein